jgi:hypothetical protein
VAIPSGCSATGLCACPKLVPGGYCEEAKRAVQFPCA